MWGRKLSNPTSTFFMSYESLQRFQKKIELDILTGCWLWKGSLNYNGYGQFKLNNKVCKAHRVSYEHWNGKIPNQLVINHICRNRQCVNPQHLEVVTIKDNTLRGVGPSAINAKKTHCPQGHPYLGDNLYISPKKDRVCKTCQRAHYKKWRCRQ